MPQHPEVVAALDAINTATNELSRELGEVGSAVERAATRVNAIADQLAQKPTAAELTKLATDLHAQASTLTSAVSALDATEKILDGIAADPTEPVPDTDPLPPVE